MSDTVVFDDDDLQHIDGGQLIFKDGYKFCHEAFGESYTDEDGTVYKVSEADVEALLDGEMISWTEPNGVYDPNERISLDVTVDAEGASEEQLQMYGEMAEIFEDAFETFVQKNLDYDSSFLSAGKVEQALDSGNGPFDSEFESNLYKVFTRIQDKDQRFYSQTFGDNENRVGEDADETSGDAMVYWAMVTWMLQYGE